MVDSAPTMRVGLRVVAVGEDVGQRVLADVAARLGDHQQHRDVGDQPADRVHEPVVAVQRDQAGDAEERRRRQVVAGDRPAVLQAGHAAAGGVEVGGVLDALGRDVGHVHRDGDDRAEHREREPRAIARATAPCASAGRGDGRDGEGAGGECEATRCSFAASHALLGVARRFPRPSGRTRCSRAARRTRRCPRRRRTATARTGGRR